MTMGKIEAIIDAVRHERYRFGLSGAAISQRRTGNGGRWVCRHGRTSCLAK